MWKKVADLILKNRVLWLVVIAVLTAFMFWQGNTRLLWSYELLKVVPDDDPDMMVFQEFRDEFGEDANVLALGFQDDELFKPENFNNFIQLTKEISEIEGIRDVLSIAQLQALRADHDKKQFYTQPLVTSNQLNQNQIDSLLYEVGTTGVYRNTLYNPETGATIALITMENDYLNSIKRIQVTEKITEKSMAFEQSSGIDVRHVGLPYVRSVLVGKIRSELTIFLIASMVVSALTLFLFFRSLSPVFFPLILILIIVIWVQGFLALFQYKVTILTGLLPSIMVVIGIPNCIYLINKYHREYYAIGDKKQSLRNVIRKIGVVTLITNTTTAIGFFVLIFTQIDALMEFGIVAGVCIFCTFFLSLIYIPSVFSMLPSPKRRNLKHIEFPAVNKILEGFTTLVLDKPKIVYAVTAVIMVAALIGAGKVRTLAYMVDDLPQSSDIKQDLSFFEENFEGIMPLEVVVDLGRKKGTRKYGNLEKVDELQTYLENLPGVTQPLSIITYLKAGNQAFFEGEDQYKLPGKRDIPYIRRYMKNQVGEANPNAQNNLSAITASFMDSTEQKVRLSMKVADLGSEKLNDLVHNQISPKIDELFDGTDLSAIITGTTLIFIKGNDYLVSNLRNSMLIAFVLIAIIMAVLFENFRIILISLIPNIIPLLTTAGLMGYMGIPLKPSTALVFSIAFGISVDDSIHFLAKYRQELIANKYQVVDALKISLKETGSSMLYTSIVLFFGFVVFTLSDFGGTQALGALTSITLFVAMVTNLILLPTLLNTFDKKHKKMQKLNLDTDTTSDPV